MKIRIGSRESALAVAQSRLVMEAIAATGDREVNLQVGEEARRLGIPVSVADCDAECSFYFPAICTGEGLVAGVVSSGKDHHKTARAAREIRKVLEELK